MCYKHLSIVLNGEIYNYKEIKQELYNLGHVFISESDTEVVLHSFIEWGNSCISKFFGMFSFAVLNKEALEISIYRDRAGVKPLFYYWHDGLFLFASFRWPNTILWPTGESRGTISGDPQEGHARYWPEVSRHNV